MEGKLGKIVIDKNGGNPIVVISDSGKYLRGLTLVKSSDECSHREKYSYYQLSKEEFIKLNYREKKLEGNNIVDCSKNVYVNNLKIREIGVLTEDSYYTLLKRYCSYQALCGADSPSYLMVRDDVHNQLIKRLQKQF